ncbi:Na(+) H(+) antiporter subunit C [hydrothermal vent metagenome]|uniref:Na(+) H(+) antiporter subunit C n=1 Tax=hydrothermal vent metagenome TaxID=652676 RepID=A0A3B1DH18_9ZZZZ
MNTVFLYSITGIIIFIIGLHGVIFYAHFLRKTLAVNIMGVGIFMFFVAMANRNPDGVPDPIPHAMVLTGIVVAVSATAFALALIVRLYVATGQTDLEAIQNKDKKGKSS